MIRNWSGSVTETPTSYVQPESPAELVSVLEGARKVRVIGAGHSFTPLAFCADTMVNIDHIRGIVSLDRERKRVRFYAGTRLRDIPALLAPYGLALANQGDVNPQSVAGAVSTGTHGTGLGYTGFAGMVTGVRLLQADGTWLDVDTSHPDFPFYQLTLGMLGIITEVEFQCVDAFDLIARESKVPFDEILEDFPQRASRTDHVEYFWFPGTDHVILKENERVKPGDVSEVEPPTKATLFFNKEVMDNGLFRLTNEISRLVPALTEPINRIATTLASNRTYRAPAHDVFVSPRRVRFHEMEYAVPLADGAEVLTEIRAIIAANGWKISFPLEVRCARADSVAMSTAVGRDTMYIAAHVFDKVNPVEYFSAIEPVFRAAGGRPHWGKMNSLTRTDITELYPRAEEFRALARRVDPDGVFATPYVAKLR